MEEDMNIKDDKIKELLDRCEEYHKNAEDSIKSFGEFEHFEEEINNAFQIPRKW